MEKFPKCDICEECFSSLEEVRVHRAESHLWANVPPESKWGGHARFIGT